MFIGFIIFGYVAIGPGIDLSDVKAREYNLDDYKSGWLRARVDDAAYWATTSACLRGDRGAGCKAMTKLVRDPHSGLFVPDGGRRHVDMSPIQVCTYFWDIWITDSLQLHTTITNWNLSLVAY